MNEITEYQQDIELAEALKRLRKNKDFKTIIEELYLDGGSINLTKNIVVVKNRDEVFEQFTARSWLYRFIMDLENNGVNAVEAIKMLSEEE